MVQLKVPEHNQLWGVTSLMSTTEEYAIGALIGTFVGDALGMPVEGWPHHRIKDRYGELDEMLDARLGAGTYTDDTQMMVATAKSLIQEEGINPEALAESFLEHHDPERGYGQGTTKVFRKLRKGRDVEGASQEIFDGGSFGNGGSMRIAPVGVLFGGEPEKLVDAIRDACGITHAHPLGLGSSFLQAYFVGEAYLRDPEAELNPENVVDQSLESLPDDWDVDGVLSRKLEAVKDLLARGDQPVEPGRVVDELGCTSKAFESVPAAIYAFCANRASFRGALVYSVGLGGDTDTIGAMSGAIAGAYHGGSAIPDHWWSQLENGDDGRDDIVELGKALNELRSSIET